MNPNDRCLFCHTATVHSYISGGKIIVKCSTCGVIDTKKTKEKNNDNSYNVCPSCKRAFIEFFPGQDTWYCYSCSNEFILPDKIESCGYRYSLPIVIDKPDKKAMFLII